MLRPIVSLPPNRYSCSDFNALTYIRTPQQPFCCCCYGSGAATGEAARFRKQLRTKPTLRSSGSTATSAQRPYASQEPREGHKQTRQAPIGALLPAAHAPRMRFSLGTALPMLALSRPFPRSHAAAPTATTGAAATTRNATKSSVTVTTCVNHRQAPPRLLSHRHTTVRQQLRPIRQLCTPRSPAPLPPPFAHLRRPPPRHWLADVTPWWSL